MPGPRDVFPSERTEASGSTTSSSLIARLRLGDKDAWNRMVELYYPLVYGWCLRQRLQPHDAVDVTQEVFRAVQAGLHNFRRDRDGDTFRGWLRGICRHKLQDFARRWFGKERAAGGTDAQLQMAAVPDLLADDDQASTAGETARLTHRALELIRMEFEDRTWQAVWRVVVEGHSPADVAADLGMTVNAIYKAKARVLNRIRQELGDGE